VHEKLPDCHFVIVGEGPLREKLANDIDTLGLRNHVHMAGLQNDIFRIYPSLDLVVSTSYSEGMPLAVLEAMGSGLPVVATNVGGLIDIVEAGYTGMLNNAGDVAGIAHNVVSLMSDGFTRREMGKAARKRVEENFDLNESVRLTSELLLMLAHAECRGESNINAADFH